MSDSGMYGGVTHPHMHGVGQGFPPIGSSIGTATAGAQQQRTKPQVTHVEIRRVQNGFVVMAINVELLERHQNFRGPQRWSFIAKDTAELGAVLTSIADGGDIDWMPSYDLPIVDLVRRVPEPE